MVKDNIKCVMKTFTDVAICYRMAPLQMLTLTYIFKIKNFKCEKSRNELCALACIMTSFIDVDIHHRMAPW